MGRLVSAVGLPVGWRGPQRQQRRGRRVWSWLGSIGDPLDPEQTTDRQGGADSETAGTERRSDENGERISAHRVSEPEAEDGEHGEQPPGRSGRSEARADLASNLLVVAQGTRQAVQHVGEAGSAPLSDLPAGG